VIYSLRYVTPASNLEEGERVEYDRQATLSDGLTGANRFQTRRADFSRGERGSGDGDVETGVVVEVQFCNMRTRSTVRDNFPGCPGAGFDDYVPCDFPVPASTGGETITESGCHSVDFVEVWDGWRFNLEAVGEFTRAGVGYYYSFTGPGPAYDQFLADYPPEDGNPDPCGYYGDPNPDGSWWGCGGDAGQASVGAVAIAVITAVDLDGDLSWSIADPDGGAQ
jgi:hypothetical protein